MSLVDLDATDLEFVDLRPAGSEQVTRMCALWRDDERGLRSVLVDFPDGWRRPGVGHQPAQEEMVAVRGAMRVSGRRAGVGELLVGAPHATRTDTSSEGHARVVVWFSGAAGGWVDGPAEPEVEMYVVELAPGVVRPPAEGLVGSVEVREDVARETFDVDVDLLWLDRGLFAHVGPGEPAPDVAGRAVVRRWA